MRCCGRHPGLSPGIERRLPPVDASGRGGIRTRPATGVHPSRLPLWTQQRDAWMGLGSIPGRFTLGLPTPPHGWRSPPRVNRNPILFSARSPFGRRPVSAGTPRPAISQHSCLENGFTGCKGSHGVKRVSRMKNSQDVEMSERQGRTEDPCSLPEGSCQVRVFRAQLDLLKPTPLTCMGAQTASHNALLPPTPPSGQTASTGPGHPPTGPP